MKIILLILLWLGLSPSLEPIIAERPVVNMPMACRQQNWLAGSGSCTHAALIALFRWQGRFATASHWRRTYGGGEYAESLAAKLDKEGIRYAYETNGDVSFLEWAVKTRRGCGVVVKGGAHMVALVHLDAKYACLMDNNRIEKFIWVSRASFLAEWAASGGWAVTPVYSPAAPMPS